MHLCSRFLPRPSANSLLDNRSHPMTNTSQAPDLEGLHHEIHDMAKHMRIVKFEISNKISPFYFYRHYSSLYHQVQVLFRQYQAPIRCKTTRFLDCQCYYRQYQILSNVMSPSSCDYFAKFRHRQIMRSPDLLSPLSRFEGKLNYSYHHDAV